MYVFSITSVFRTEFPFAVSFINMLQSSEIAVIVKIEYIAPSTPPKKESGFFIASMRLITLTARKSIENIMPMTAKAAKNITFLTVRSITGRTISASISVTAESFIFSGASRAFSLFILFFSRYLSALSSISSGITPFRDPVILPQYSLNILFSLPLIS